MRMCIAGATMSQHITDCLTKRGDIHRKIKRLSMRIKSSKLDIDVFPSSSVLLPTPSCE